MLHLLPGAEPAAPPGIAVRHQSRRSFPAQRPQNTHPTPPLCAGGWAGGEQGLKAFVADYQREKELNAAPAPKAKAAPRAPQPIAKGDDTIYVGKGRVIKDDARK